MTWRQVPEAFLKACRLRAAGVLRCPWQLLVRPSPRISEVLRAAGCEGSQEAPSPPLSGALTPVCLLTFLTPQGRFLAKEFCPLRVRLPGRGPGVPCLEAWGYRPERGPGGSSSRKRGPHPGTKPRSRVGCGRSTQVWQLRAVRGWGRGIVAPGPGRTTGAVLSQALKALTPRATGVTKSGPAPGEIQEASQARPGGGARSPNPGPSP